MLLPKGRPVHRDLGTAYVKVDHFIRELKEEGFSGYLCLENPDVKGVLFFEQGGISGAYTEPPTADPLLAIMEEASREGAVNVYGLPPEVVHILASAARGERVYEALPLEIVHLDRLMERLERESFTGIMKVEDGDRDLTVLLFEGDPVEFLYEGEEALQGEEAMAKLEELRSSLTALIYLFKSGEEREELEFDPQEVLEVLGGFFSSYRPQVEKALGEGKFERMFREASLSLAERFSFLDPFASLVRITPGGLEVEEGVSVVRLLEGIRELVKEMNRLVEEKKGKEAVKEIMGAIVSSLGDQPFVGSLFGEGKE
jgi:hypothetical protein